MTELEILREEDYICKNCKSKKLEIFGDEHDEEGIVSKLFIKCKECGEITELTFGVSDKNGKCIKGKVEE